MNNSIENSHLVLTEEWTEEDIKVICNGLIKHNRKNARPLDEQFGETINIILKTEDGQVAGGIMCNMYMYALDIDVLWVDEKYRHTGYGSKLIDRAVELAKELGCILVHTTTFSYQAPNFYTKCGFEIYGVLEGFPEGIKMYRLKKNVV